MNNPRCVNLACVCTVTMLGDACSDGCKSSRSGSGDDIVCHCGHGACAQEMKEELGEGTGPSS